MTWDDGSARAAARSAYERGRIKRAVWVAVWIAPLVGLGMAMGTQPLLTLSLGALLVVVATAARWRGGTIGSAATTGVLAGLPAYGVPLFGMWGSGACSGACCTDWCLTLCVSGGLITGVALGIYSATRQSDRTLHVAVTLGVAALTAAVGCATYGFAAFGAMSATALVLAGGVAVLVPARA
jgi:hypothetical protein